MTPTRWTLGLAALAYGASRALRARRAIAFAGTSVAIFGGSRGLGLAVAQQMAREGARLGLFARNAKELAVAVDMVRPCGGEVFGHVCDVRDRAQVDVAIARQADVYGGIDVLINDAGVIQVGPFEHMRGADFEDAMNTHFWGPLFAIEMALPYLRTAGAGRIVNISSIGGRIAVPHLLPYSASKFALVGLSEGLRAELAKDGIAVTTVCPGLMRTGSTYNARFKGQHRAEFAWFHLADSLPGLSVAARTAAARVVDACRHGDANLVIGLPARVAIVLNALCPATWARLTALADTLLPKATSSAGDVDRAGWQSTSRAVPSPLTMLADRASLEFNQFPRPFKA
jgi:NAD(P)-dependent dehydrogenase (short-subunit alcohol dehydrogenase family)